MGSYKSPTPRWDLFDDVHTLVYTTGHSGSKALTQALNRLGVRAGHECVFRLIGRRPCDGGEPHEIEVSHPAHWHIDAILKRKPYLNIVHMVRDPLMVYESLSRIPDTWGVSKYWAKHGFRRTPEFPLDYMRLYYDTARERGWPHFRVEDPHMAERVLGVDGLADSLYNLGKRVNQHKPRKNRVKPDLRWYSEVRDWRLEFGYE